MYIYKDILGRFLNKSSIEGSGLHACVLHPQDESWDVKGKPWHEAVSLEMKVPGLSCPPRVRSHLLSWGTPLRVSDLFPLPGPREGGALFSSVYPCFGHQALGWRVPSVCWVQLRGWGSGFIISSGQIKVPPEKGPRFPSDSKEAAAYISALEDWGCESYGGLKDRG